MAIHGLQGVTRNFQIKGLARALWAFRKHLAVGDETYEVYNRIKLNIDGSQLYQWWNVINYAGFDVVLLLERLLRPGDVFLDAGANLGYISLNAAKIVGPQGHVLAMEPEPRVQERLLANIKLNDARNITVIPKAAGRKIGTAMLHVATDHGLSRLQGISEESFGMVLLNKVEVPVTTIQSVVEEHSSAESLKIVKMDIEGSEFAALEGMLPTLAKGSCTVIFESNPGALAQQNASFRDIYFLFEQYSYQVYAIDSHTADWFRASRLPTLIPITDPADYSDHHFDGIAVPLAMLPLQGIDISAAPIWRSHRR